MSDYQITPSLQITKKQLKDIVTTYFSKASARSYRFVHLNVTDGKVKAFVMTNIIGRELIKVYNSEIRFRIMEIASKKHVDIIKWLFDKFLTKTNRKTFFVIDVLQMITTLNKVSYDLEALDLHEDSIGTVSRADGDKLHVISYIERDVQSIYFVSELFSVYYPYMTSYSDDVIDITDDITASNKSVEIALDKKINLTLHNGLDYPDKKWLKTNEGSTLVKYVPSEIGVKLITLSSTEGDYSSNVLTSRVYITYYYKKKRRGKRK